MELYKNRDWLYEQYVVKQRTYKDIADELDVRLSTICAWRKKLDIPVVKRLSDSNTEVTLICHYCGDDFTSTKRYVKRRQRDYNQEHFYCSKSCQFKNMNGKVPVAALKYGSDNNMWKGGVSGINENLRSSIKQWKQDVAKAQNYTCCITGKRINNFHIHHITPFHVIRDEAIAELGIELKATLAENDEEVIGRLKRRIVDVHEQEQGYVVTAELHQLFHTIYGYKTTEIDFEEFKTRYQSGEFNAISTQKEAR